MRAIGLMSGTSLDGVDVATIDTDGETIERLGPTGYRSYSEAERYLLGRATADARSLHDRASRPGALAEAERLVTEAHAEAVEQFLRHHRLESSSIGVIGFHGQTVLHAPKMKLTVQIGDGAELARRLRIPVIYDFRAADVAAGGEGAPLVPIFHQALARQLKLPHPIGILNIGGVANITYLDGDAPPLAFDVGPGNAPIDEIARARTGAPHDRDGRLAAAGRANAGMIARVLAHPFFAAPPPKSLDRTQFAMLPLDAFSTEDAAATATAIVVGAIARALDHLPRAPARIVVAGGGARNPVLLSMLRKALSSPVLTADQVGWSGDALEAEAFAFLAVRSLRGLPISFPSTTGVREPTAGGRLAQP